MFLKPKTKRIDPNLNKFEPIVALGRHIPNQSLNPSVGLLNKAQTNNP